MRAADRGRRRVGLDAVGASAQETASALFVLSVTMGLGSIVFSWRLRRPITMAWSTPGAALLAGAVAPDGGYATAVGAFVVEGVRTNLPLLAAALADPDRTVEERLRA